MCGPVRQADRSSAGCRRSAPTRMLVPAGKRRTMDGVADTKKKVRVVVADDHPLYREGVVRALTASGRVDVVAQSEDGRGALDQIREHSPDVALIDYKLPELDG